MAWTNVCSSSFYRKYVLENLDTSEDEARFKQTRLSEFAET